mgnify:CR=1 FL=1
MGKIKQIWDKFSPNTKQWIIVFLVGMEAALFYRFLIPIEIKLEYGKRLVHIVNLLVHWMIFIPVLNKLLLKGK